MTPEFHPFRFDSVLFEGEKTMKFHQRFVLGDEALYGLGQFYRDNQMNWRGQIRVLVQGNHHAENWMYFPAWDKNYETGDPCYSGLYGEIHKKGAQPGQKFLEKWEGKIIEVIDKYDPDFIWFDYGLDVINEEYAKDLLAYHYNQAAKEKKEVVVSYKGHDLPPGVGINDLELGQEAEMTYHEWITDSSVDSIGTMPWIIAGEDPTKLEAKGTNEQVGKASFNEKQKLIYAGEDIRYTIKDNTLYATFLDWPGEKAIKICMILKGPRVGLYPSEIVSITMLGDGKELK